MHQVISRSPSKPWHPRSDVEKVRRGFSCSVHPCTASSSLDDRVTFNGRLSIWSRLAANQGAAGDRKVLRNLIHDQAPLRRGRGWVEGSDAGRGGSWLRCPAPRFARTLIRRCAPPSPGGRRIELSDGGCAGFGLRIARVRCYHAHPALRSSEVPVHGLAQSAAKSQPATYPDPVVPSARPRRRDGSDA
jgi:hypothetical protein